MAQREGPWIEHDGKGFPHKLVRQEYKKGATAVTHRMEGNGRTKISCEQYNPGRAYVDNPVWSWTYKRSHALFGKLKRVCTDPAYAPCLKYRFIYEDPDAKATEAEVEKLRDLVADPEAVQIADDPAKQNAPASSHVAEQPQGGGV